MKNIGQMMKQAQEMQSKMAALQEQLAAHEVAGVAAGGMVEIRMNGKGEMRSVRIDPTLCDPKEVEVLEDLILAPASDAKAKVESHMAEAMKDLTGGLALPPGFKLPF